MPGKTLPRLRLKKQRLAEKRLAESVAQAMEQASVLPEATEDIEQDESQEMGVRM